MSQPNTFWPNQNWPNQGTNINPIVTGKLTIVETTVLEQRLVTQVQMVRVNSSSGDNNG